MSNVAWRRDKRYHHWREEVLKRDNYTCQICGAKEHLTAHHKNNGSYFPDDRYDVNNGVTLCHDCHSNFHNNYKRSYRQKCTEYDWNNFNQLVSYFKKKCDTKHKEDKKD